MAAAGVVELRPDVSPPAGRAGHPDRIAAIDGLRAMAILLVILDHYVPWIVTGDGAMARYVREASGSAGSGVDLFFVLSGFLITGILVDSKGSPNYFARFYWRRSMRIFPVYYAYLLPLLFMPGFFTQIGRPWFVFYLRNWRGVDPASDGVLGHLWSLAVEEQFYIGWSIVVFLVATRWLPHVTMALIAFAPLVRAVMNRWGYSGYEIFRATPARMDSLLLGALVALAARSSWKNRLPSAARIAALVAIAGLAIARIITGPLTLDTLIIQLAYPFFAPLLYASILALCLVGRPLGCPAVLRKVARYSYAIYLFHLVVGRLIFVQFQGLAKKFLAAEALIEMLFIPVAFAVVYALAVISWRCLESPALRLKDRFFQEGQCRGNGNFVNSELSTSASSVQPLFFDTAGR
jgi:peptidoglycan/LPS O-acetylase OafA/YrhL